jgi:hypothetical protein
MQQVQILIDAVLSRDTAGVVVAYLTPLPPLPYIDQLLCWTRNIWADLGIYKYNSNPRGWSLRTEQWVYCNRCFRHILFDRNAVASLHPRYFLLRQHSGWDIAVLDNAAGAGEDSGRVIKIPDFEENEQNEQNYEEWKRRLALW